MILSLRTLISDRHGKCPPFWAAHVLVQLRPFLRLTHPVFDPGEGLLNFCGVSVLFDKGADEQVLRRLVWGGKRPDVSRGESVKLTVNGGC